MCTRDLRSCSPNKMSCGGVSKAFNVSQSGGRRQTFTGMTNKRRGRGAWGRGEEARWRERDGDRQGQRETERQRQKDRQTEVGRHINKQRERTRHRQTETDREKQTYIIGE